MLRDGHLETEVEAILDSRVHHNGLQCLVDWIGKAEVEREWRLRASEVPTSLALSFHSEHPSSPITKKQKSMLETLSQADQTSRNTSSSSDNISNEPSTPSTSHAHSSRQRRSDVSSDLKEGGNVTHAPRPPSLTTRSDRVPRPHQRHSDFVPH